MRTDGAGAFARPGCGSDRRAGANRTFCKGSTVLPGCIGDDFTGSKPSMRVTQYSGVPDQPPDPVN
ncbi:MAG TPA: hypothetical protein DEB47_07750 [Citreicella sp.]|nr:hypothetical protein [Citreicella sp.]